MGAHGGGAAAVHLDDVQEAVVHRAVGQVGIADAWGAPCGRRLHRHNIPSLIVNKRTLNVSSSSSFPPEGQALKTASKVHQQGHSSGRRVGGSRSGSCLASQCRPQGEASRTRAAAPTCAGGVAFGGRVVPGGMTLWPTWVVVTAVQLLVKDMGAVFSRTCISQRCPHHPPWHAGLNRLACSPGIGTCGPWEPFTGCPADAPQPIPGSKSYEKDGATLHRLSEPHSSAHPAAQCGIS